jgi:Ca2+-transporting ATPase
MEEKAIESKERENSWHNLTTEKAIAALDTNAEEGLDKAEVARRTRAYGLNELKEAPPKTIWAKLWAQFNDFVIWLLIGASLISAALGEWVEAGAIMAIVILNAILGIVQEQRAEEELAALKKLAAPVADAGTRRHRCAGSREFYPR